VANNAKLYINRKDGFVGTNMKKEDFQALKSKNKNICVSIQKVATVSLVLGLSACSKPAEEPRLLGKIAPNTSCESNVTTPPKNRLAPFPIVDQNKTIHINRIAEPQLAGGIMMPIDIPKI
jgi:hypothetical protein